MFVSILVRKIMQTFVVKVSSQYFFIILHDDQENQVKNEQQPKQYM